MKPRTLDHRHVVFRVVRAEWANPLDVSFSRSAPDRRWNTSEFGALYFCCSEGVARAIVHDLFRISGVELEELQPAYLPQLIEVRWEGRVADLASEEGVRAAGFLSRYPQDVRKADTRAAAVRFQKQSIEGVVCRSASLARMGLAQWRGDHSAWSELAVFEAAADKAQIIRRRSDLGWLKAGLQVTVGTVAQTPILNRNDFVGNSPLIRVLLREALLAAQKSDKPILITGAVGVGKSHLARLIHGWSSRASRTMVVVDCGSLPKDFDNVLIGHRSGTFRSAVRDLGRLLQEANGGTLVLEDFDRLSLHHQDLLHRVLSEGRFFPVGSTREVRVDLRFIGTTSKDVRREVEAGRLKEDFVSRLDYLPLHVPPLHRRPEDIPALAAELLRRHVGELRQKGLRDGDTLVFHKDCGPALQARTFDDNVRGLDRLVARLIVVVGEGTEIYPADIEAVSPMMRREPALRAFERPKTLQMVRDAAEQRYILDVCHYTDWNLRRTSRILGISPKSLYAKLKQYGISRPM